MARGLKSLKGKSIKLKGGSVLGIGASWEISNTERDEIRKFIANIEDRRVLFNPRYLEVESQVTHSISEIRKLSGDAIGKIPEGSPAISAIRAIRAACRRFLDQPPPEVPNFFDRHRHSDPNAGFFIALGEFRTTVVLRLAELASEYGIELDEALARVLPPTE